MGARHVPRAAVFGQALSEAQTYYERFHTKLVSWYKSA